MIRKRNTFFSTSFLFPTISRLSLALTFCCSSTLCENKQKKWLVEYQTYCSDEIRKINNKIKSNIQRSAVKLHHAPNDSLSDPLKPEEKPLKRKMKRKTHRQTRQQYCHISPGRACVSSLACAGWRRPSRALVLRRRSLLIRILSPILLRRNGNGKSFEALRRLSRTSVLLFPFDFDLI